MSKLFKDPVHGYIRVPDDLCRSFIDTLIFQRLRHIEQTSMRCLFPGARHDRFVHSLGVYHLGARAYSALLRNTEEPPVIEVLKDERLHNTFLIACLMHDCGHAPFSHTFEDYYNETPSGSHGRAFALLKTLVGGHEDFVVAKEGGFKPAAHEAFSAAMLITHFGNVLKGQWDPVLAARMITGCRHHLHASSELRLKVENTLISLLNNKVVDVDKLDYIIRDTWASGVKNTAVDMERLVDAFTLTIEADYVELALRSSALSVIQSVADARNYLYEWVYNHHTVHYYADRLKTALKGLAETFAEESKPYLFWDVFFSKEVFDGPVPLANNSVSIHLPTDGDVLALMKTRIASNPAYRELATHQADRFALWKTQAEFRQLFGGRTLLPNRSMDLIAREFGVAKSDMIYCKANAKLYFIKEHDIKVLMPNKKLASFKQLSGQETRQSEDSPKFFYLYLPKAFEGRVAEVNQLLFDEARSAG